MLKKTKTKIQVISLIRALFHNMIVTQIVVTYSISVLYLIVIIIVVVAEALFIYIMYMVYYKTFTVDSIL